MDTIRIPWAKVGLLLCALTVPAVAHAQSAMIGVVRDSSGAVLPGVTVEAASEAIIERTKTATTNGDGQFRIVDLRPGIYDVSFTLNGFQTLKRTGLELPAEFTMTVNADLRVGQVAETVVVTGASPVVDTQSSVQVTRLDRTALETLPAGQNIWEMGQLIPGVQLSAPTVGGQGGATQTYMTVHGMTSAQNVVLVDGLSVSGFELNGYVQNYFNPATSQEVTYQTSGISADRSGGGITINMIPREGGNRFSGDANINYRPGDWIANNLTRRLKDMGAEFVNSLEYLSDFTLSEGGPIKRDTLWFFGSFHQFNTSDLVANTRFDDGSQGTDTQHLRQGSLRLTYQMTSRHKLSGYFEKIGKLQSNQMGANVDPETASIRQTSPNYSTGGLKFTSTITNKMLFEGGYSVNREHRDEFGQPGIIKEAFTPEWFAGISKTTNEVAAALGNAGPRTNAPYVSESTYPQRDNLQASLSYVAGSHNVKVGAQYQWGFYERRRDNNGHLSARFDNFSVLNNEIVFTTPVDVLVWNTPVFSRDRLNRDLGVYAQDSWNLRRLTVNYGLRWEQINAQTDATAAPAGRFVPARTAASIKNVPNWTDIAPRFSVIYDLFGNAKTALKYSINRYNRSVTDAIAGDFNLMTLTARTLPWTDLNNNGIPEVPSAYDTGGSPTFCTYQAPGCEINLTALRSTDGRLFGTLGDLEQFENYERGWNLEQAIELQHELLPRVSTTFAWTRGVDHDLTNTVNINRRDGDYRPVQIFNPVDGTPITVYSIVDAETQARLNLGGDSANINFTDPARRSVYNQFLYDVRARFAGGGFVSGAVTSSRELDRDCQAANPAYVINPNELRFCDQFNLPDGHSIPFAHDLRVAGSLPLKYGITLGVVYLNNDEGSIDTSYSIRPGATAGLSTVYPNGAATPTRRVANQPAPPCPTTNGCVPGAYVLPSGFLLPVGSTLLTFDLYPDRSRRAERLNQLDFRLSKTFRAGKLRFDPTVAVHNAFNSDTIIDYQSTSYASSASNYLIPDDVLLGRVWSFGATVKW